MDLNDFIFRDDSTEPLGAGASGDIASDETESFGAEATLGLAVIAGAVVGLSHLLGHAPKGL